MKVEEVFVTPEIADDWLSKSPGNRPLGQLDVLDHMQSLSRAHAAGRDDGMLSPDPVVFSISGALINAHHRLTAISKTRIGSRLLVCFDYPDDLEMQARIDVGRRRSIAHQAYFAGHDVAFMRRAGEIQRSLLVASHLRNRIQYADTLHFIERGSDALRWSIRLSRVRFPAIMAGAACYAHPLDPARIEALYADAVATTPATEHGNTLAGVIRDARRAVSAGSSSSAFDAPFSRALSVVRRWLDRSPCVIAQPWPRAISDFDERRRAQGLPSLVGLAKGENT